MRVTVHNGALAGTVRAIPSKSDAHRQLIAAALADTETTLIMGARSDDINATIRAIESLGAAVRETDNGVAVRPVWGNVPSRADIDCGESGSTLRFLLPVAPALGVDAHFITHGRLGERPNTALNEALAAHRLGAQLTPGAYELPGNISSQYFTGLMLALPLLSGPSTIRPTTALESAGYIDLSIEVLRRFGIRIEWTGGEYLVPAPQRFTSPGTSEIEGDWSNAAFFIAANAMGSSVSVIGLSAGSRQADRRISGALELIGGEIDASQTPDLVPILAVAAASRPVETRIMNAARLRIKESDRLAVVTECLTRLGADVTELPDGLIIRGGRLRGGTVSAHNDHRIAMAMAVAGTVTERPVIIEGAEAVNKSYPKFFDDLIMLGGRVDVEHVR